MQQGSGSSHSFAIRRADYFARKGTEAQQMSDGSGVASNDPKATFGEEETALGSKESSANKQ